MVLGKELDKIIIQLFEKMNESTFAQILGFDIVRFKLFLTDIYRDDKDENNIIIETESVEGNSGYFNLRDLDTENKIRFQDFLLKVYNQLENN